MKQLLMMIAVTASTATCNAWANRYTILDLGDGPNPIGVNRVDVVVANIVGRRARGEVYRGGAWHKLPTRSQAWAINRAGDVVGVDYRTAQPFLWPHGGESIPIELPEGSSGNAFGVNNDSVVVGDFSADDGSERCYMWTPNSGATDLGGDQFRVCIAQAVNNLGQITGEAALPNAGPPHAFLWDKGQFTDLGVPVGANSATGLAVSDSGVVVGEGYLTNGSVAFMWNGTLINLDPRHEFYASVATSVNSSNEVVGWTQKDQLHDTTAVRFARSEIIRLEPEVVNIGDWKLEQATSINDKGVIVGIGKIQRESHAFMLVPQ